MTNPMPRPEHPCPQSVRPTWLCLNGEWEFADDYGDSGEEHGWLNTTLPERITVPFCRESKLSGLHRTDRCMAVWYAREITPEAAWKDKRILLHIGAADYETTIWVNGARAGFHRGGHVPIKAEITDFVTPGEPARIVIRCRDPWLSVQPRGKQSSRVLNSGCHYDRTTGIWQTVWMEAVGASYLKRPRITPLVEQSAFLLEAGVDRPAAGQLVEARLLSGGNPIATETVEIGAGFVPTLLLKVPESNRRLWTPDDPHLYDLEVRLLDRGGTEIDALTSYAGLRGISVEANRFLINGKRLFQRLVLDQGYYPDGILTAPSDEALRNDILLSQKAGFNGARLHQKVFEERFLYHADRLGYLVWGEMPDWNIDVSDEGHKRERWNASWITEWLEALHRDYSHPSIIGWCPMNEQMPKNESERKELEFVMRSLFFATKEADRTRPVLDVSGWAHRIVESDVYDDHSYQQDPEKLAAKYAGVGNGDLDINWKPEKPDHVPYRGQPFFLSEFGGIKWNPDDTGGWGYGEAPKSIEEFYQRFEGMCGRLLDNPGMFGYCYTQLTDVFQEQNGIYRFDRSVKFDMERIARAQKRPAAYEVT